MARYGTTLQPARARTARALLLLPLLPALAGCETLERMDYLDRFFDPEGYYARHAPTLMAGPDRAPLPITASPPNQVRAMEARPNAPAVTPEPSTEPAAPTSARGTPAPEDPELRLRRTVRQHLWLTRFWSELTATEQGRVARQLRRSAAPAGAPPFDPATAWDVMGLSDRAALVFGGSLPAGQPARVPPEGETPGGESREAAAAWQEAPR